MWQGPEISILNFKLFSDRYHTRRVSFLWHKLSKIISCRLKLSVQRINMWSKLAWSTQNGRRWGRRHAECPSFRSAWSVAPDRGVAEVERCCRICIHVVDYHCHHWASSLLVGRGSWWDLVDSKKQDCAHHDCGRCTAVRWGCAGPLLFGQKWADSQRPVVSDGARSFPARANIR